MSEQLISDADCAKLIMKENAIYCKFELLRLAENSGGFLGEHFYLVVTYLINNKEETKNFFLKSKLNTGSNAVLGEILLAFEKETFFYETLVKDYEKRGYNTTFAPKMLLCKNNNIIIMENLTDNGFFLSGKYNFFDLDKIQAALTALAHFHGLSFKYEEDKSKELKSEYRLNVAYPEMFKERFLLFADENSPGSRFFSRSTNYILTLIGFLDESEDWKEDFRRRLKEVNFRKIFETELGTRKCCGHGDLWSNNIMFKQNNNKLQSCILDYQVLRYFNPALDSLYIIYTNTRKELRDLNMKNLLNYYYTCLTNVIGTETVYSKTDFKRSVNFYNLFTKINTSFAHMLTFLNVQKVKKILGELEDNKVTDKSKLFQDAFKNDELFREILTEDMYEIRNLLVQSKSLL